MSASASRLSLSTAVIAVLIVLAPTAIGLLRQGAYVIQTPLQLFSLGTELVSLVFPLLAAVVAASRLNAEVGDGYVRMVRTRANFPRYLRERVVSASSIAFVVFFASMFLWFVVAFVVDPLLGISNDPGNTYATAAEAIAADQSSAMYSQLIAVSPWLYGVAYSIWVGIWAAVWAAFSCTLLITVPSRIAAYAVPFVAYTAENVLLANLGLPQFRAGLSAFPFSMTQQPILFGVVPLVVWALIVVVLWLGLRASRYETAPLT